MSHSRAKHRKLAQYTISGVIGSCQRGRRMRYLTITSVLFLREHLGHLIAMSGVGPVSSATGWSESNSLAEHFSWRICNMPVQAKLLTRLLRRIEGFSGRPVRECKRQGKVVISHGAEVATQHPLAIRVLDLHVFEIGWN